MSKYTVFGTLTTDCSIVINAESEEDAKRQAKKINWDEWDTEPNNFEVNEARCDVISSN